MPRAWNTFCSSPPHSVCFFNGLSVNDWTTSRFWPHFLQVYSYVGMVFEDSGRWEKSKCRTGQGSLPFPNANKIGGCQSPLR